MTQISRRTFLAGAAGVVAAGVSLAPHPVRSSLPKFDAERFVDDVKRAHLEKESQKAVEAVLARAVSEPRAILNGLGEPREAGIHTLYESDDLTILNVVWAPLMVLLPHNHNMWASIGIYRGREDNITWQAKGPVIEATGAASLSEREVFGLPDSGIHSVVNPIGRLTAAIHIYGGDFFDEPRSEWDPETLVERPFDLEAARQTFIDANERFKAGR